MMGKTLGEIIVFMGIVIALLLPLYLGLVQGKSFEDVQWIFLCGLAISVLGLVIYGAGKNKHGG